MRSLEEAPGPLDGIASVGDVAAVAMTRRRAATAFHEAGHAVVAFHLGMGVREVSILSSDDAEGHVLHYASHRGSSPML